MTNTEFLEAIRESFATYLSVGTSRSTKKLKSLHGCIAIDLQRIFGDEFEIQSQGYRDDKEGDIVGRYYPKKVDITVKKDGRPVAGYAVKFVMRNYAQNSNNYFENMLGETANIRVEAIPYFQIFILFEKVPYYKKGGEFQRYDIISDCNLGKYIRLSQDNPDLYHHTPDKTLLVLLRLKEKELNYMFANADDYAEFYQSVIDDSDLLTYANQWKDSFDNTVICNDYENFVKRSYHIVMGKLK